MQLASWRPQQEYHIGDSVIYQGRIYHIIQPHVSQADWIPPETPALWNPGKAAGSEVGQRPPPQVWNQNPMPYHRGGEGNDRLEGMGFDHHREGPWDHHGGPPPDYERHRGIPDPDPHRGFPEADHHRVFPEAEHHRGFPEPDHQRDFPEPNHHRGPPGDGRGWDGPRDHHRDREFGSGNREQVYEAEDRAMREGHLCAQGLSGGGDYRNPTKYSSSAEWIEDAKHRTREVHEGGPREAIFWLLAEPGHIPRHAIQAGEDKEGNPTFICRNFHEGGLHIGWAGLQHAFISYGGGDIPLATFEVLSGDSHAIRWVASKQQNGRPIEAGYEADGKPLWICQGMVGGMVLAGKTAAWDSGGYIAYEGREEIVPEYNILCHA